MSISAVSEACGFSDPLYFSRVFKKRFGKSPVAYRKEFVKE
jgi:AraC-like DNA-binding protein